MTYVFRLLKKVVIFFGGLYPCALAVFLLRALFGLFPLGGDARTVSASVLTGVLLGAVLYLSGRKEGYQDTAYDLYSFVRGPVMTIAAVIFYASFHADILVLIMFSLGAAGDIAGYFTGHFLYLKTKSFIIEGGVLSAEPLPLPEARKAEEPVPEQYSE